MTVARRSPPAGGGTPPVDPQRPLRLAGSEVGPSLTHNYYRRTTCRICKSPRIHTFLDFGPTPVANAFRERINEPDQRFPLSCCYCEECGLVQVPDIVDPRVLFSTYTYFSSASQPMVEHFKRQAESIRQQYLTDPSCLICEIGSNDGIFLQNLVGKCRVIGVDPADNIATTAALKGVTTVNKFFNPRTAEIVRELFGAPKVVFAANCFAHIDDIDGIMEGIVRLLSDDGVYIFENHRFVDMLRHTCFDQIYHEHLAFYTLRPIEHLMKRYGMRVIDVRSIPTQGESFQIHCARIDSAHREQPGVRKIRDEEEALGLNRVETYQNLARDVGQLQAELKKLLLDLRAAGKRIVGYGAPGKATTLLHALGLGQETIEYAIDTTQIKQGRYIPGTRIHIRPPQTLEVDRPDYLLLFAWNYADAILKKEQPLRDKGIKFIVPVPKLQIV
ncbi:MAG TPA: class I SAM-dependent methyltransferase [Phycisphaerales bacterium]|nr:class I SAM-dependent methyltransferase [Phycisphaerales bacterium]